MKILGFPYVIDERMTEQPVIKLGPLSRYHRRTHMTVAEYIAKLQALPQNLEVVVSGVEGCDNAQEPHVTHVLWDAEPGHDYYSPHQYARPEDPRATAVVLLG